MTEFGSLSQDLTFKIRDIISKFDIQMGNITNIEILNNGRINRSYKLTMQTINGFATYMLQEINTSVFKDPLALMTNVVSVANHIASKGKRTINMIRLKQNVLNAEYGWYVYYEDGNINETHCWRLYSFIEANVLNSVEIPKDMYSLGQAIGEFALSLDDFEAGNLQETIKGFHDTPMRLKTMISRIMSINFGENAFLKDRCKECQEDIEFILSRADKASLIVDALKLGSIPVRVSHNDPKLNNVLFDKNTGEVLCLIDLDTVMSGTILYDFGDAARYGCNEETEEAVDTEKVYFNLERFTNLVQGLIKSMNTLTTREVNLLYDAVWAMTFELAIRFLDDHINLNSYFKAEYDGKNLERARVQMALLKDIENKEKKMREIVTDVSWTSK